MNKMFCKKCKRQYRVKKVGIEIVETYEDGIEPYMVRRADIYACGCSELYLAADGTHVKRGETIPENIDRVQ